MAGIPNESLQEATAGDIDCFAWEAIRDWPHLADVRVMHEGLDYSLLSRFFLWDKVGRALRHQLDPERFAFEAERDWEARHSQAAPQAFDYQNGQQGPRSRSRPLLLSPWPSTRLAAATEGIIQAGAATIAVLGQTDIPGYEECEQILNLPRPADPDPQFPAQLHQAILEALHVLGIELLTADIELLREQLREQTKHVRFVESVFAACRPDALLVHTDNHPPYQDYVMVAERAGIPTVMLQHGLDCERYYLEDTFATVVATWGEARANRYRQLSNRQPDRIEATGNPAYDRLRLPESIDDRGNYWLWTTRPHVSSKCLSPSRWPQEGLSILEAFVDCLTAVPSARLVIKPHPFDYTELYRERVARSSVADRIEISQSSLDDLIDDAAVVVSEDSTAGMDAMFRGKPLCHVHLAATTPVTPFVDYGAALPAFSADQLLGSLQRASELASKEKKALLDGQRQFLNDHAGECDGRARERVVSLVADVC